MEKEVTITAIPKENRSSVEFTNGAMRNSIASVVKAQFGWELGESVNVPQVNELLKVLREHKVGYSFKIAGMTP